jgi:hypothetical protein
MMIAGIIVCQKQLPRWNTGRQFMTDMAGAAEIRD